MTRHIYEGFQIEVPEVFVPWAIYWKDMRLLLDTHGLVQRERNFFTLDCISLGGLSDELGFAFTKTEGLLYEISFYHLSKQPPKESFESFQEHLQAAYGQPRERHKRNP